MCMILSGRIWLDHGRCALFNRRNPLIQLLLVVASSSLVRVHRITSSQGFCLGSDDLQVNALSTSQVLIEPNDK
ncbi:hypothetical protein BDR06DRAFT_233478 [Suillus hirtellus]|nr:hypothetical protein BDR06DRAFT_233478 [Suillus hirtellus]